MARVRTIRIEEEILADNAVAARHVRERLSESGTFLLNLMSSPGSGKTSLILNTIESLGNQLRIGVIEADIDSSVDALKVAETGTPALQINTGGCCHVEACMVERILQELDPAAFDLLILENVGNLVCPAEFDTGAAANAMILSVPEGHDKPQKYPLMFATTDVIVLNKIDYLPVSDFDRELFLGSVRKLNSNVPVFEISCRTGDRIDQWAEWLRRRVREANRRSQ